MTSEAQSEPRNGFAEGPRMSPRSCSASMFICFLVQILFRYVFNNPVGWTEEVSIVCWMWTVLWGAAFVLAETEEIRFDIVYATCPKACGASSR